MCEQRVTIQLCLWYIYVCVLCECECSALWCCGVWSCAVTLCCDFVRCVSRVRARVWVECIGVVVVWICHGMGGLAKTYELGKPHTDKHLEHTHKCTSKLILSVPLSLSHM